MHLFCFHSIILLLFLVLLLPDLFFELGDALLHTYLAKFLIISLLGIDFLKSIKNKRLSLSNCYGLLISDTKVAFREGKSL